MAQARVVCARCQRERYESRMNYQGFGAWLCDAVVTCKSVVRERKRKKNVLKD